MSGPQECMVGVPPLIQPEPLRGGKWSPGHSVWPFFVSLVVLTTNGVHQVGLFILLFQCSASQNDKSVFFPLWFYFFFITILVVVHKLALFFNISTHSHKATGSLGMEIWELPAPLFLCTVWRHLVQWRHLVVSPLRCELDLEPELYQALGGP